MAIPGLGSVHHIAIICSDYERSKHFYVELMGGKVIAETYRGSRASYKLDIQFAEFQIELFSFPNPPKRLSKPEGQGLRHLAFKVAHLNEAIAYLINNEVSVEPVRIDELTGNKFTFFQDPDGLPLELVEC